MYDEKHRFFELHKDRAWRDRPVQRGYTEPLLCIECEQLFAGFERYAAGVMNGRSSASFVQSPGYVRVSGLDYERFKLFLLSVLWRASVATHEFFKLVSLGPRERILKTMLLEGRPGRCEEYGCMVVFSSLEGEDISDTMFNPEPYRWAGRRMIKFFFAGASWCFYCDSQSPPRHLRRLFLQEDGTLRGLSMDLQDARDVSGAARAFAKELGLV